MRRPKNFKNLNPHINFDREGAKSNARKDDTKVICCKCHIKFVLPFKPRIAEVYCDACFKNRPKGKAPTIYYKETNNYNKYKK